MNPKNFKELLKKYIKSPDFSLNNQSLIFLNSIKYICSYIIGNGFLIVTLPYLKAKLELKEFGHLTNVQQFLNFVQFLTITLGATTAFRYYSNVNVKDRTVDLSNSLLLIFIVWGASSFVVFLAKDHIFNHVYVNSKQIFIENLPLLLLLYLLMSVKSFLLSIYKAQENPNLLMKWKVIQGATFIILIVGLDLSGNLKINYIILVLVLLETLIIAFNNSEIYSYLKVISLNADLIKIIKFGSITALGSLFYMVAAFIDKIRSTSILSIDDQAIYNYGFLIGNVSSWVVSSMSSSFTARYLNEKYSKKNVPNSQIWAAYIGKRFSLIIISIFILMVPITLLLDSQNFSKMLIVAWGTIFTMNSRFLCLPMSNVLYSNNRTSSIAFANFIMLCLTVLICQTFFWLNLIYLMPTSMGIAYLLLIPLHTLLVNRIGEGMTFCKYGFVFSLIMLSLVGILCMFL